MGIDDDCMLMFMALWCFMWLNGNFRWFDGFVEALMVLVMFFLFFCGIVETARTTVIQRGSWFPESWRGTPSHPPFYLDFPGKKQKKTIYFGGTPIYGNSRIMLSPMRRHCALVVPYPQKKGHSQAEWSHVATTQSLGVKIKQHGNPWVFLGTWST